MVILWAVFANISAAQTGLQNSVVTEAELIAPLDAAAGQGFGYRVAVDDSDQWLAVSAYLDDVSGFASGSVYLFKKNQNGQWSQYQKLSADDGASNDVFGSSIALSSDTLLVGAPFDSDNGVDSGSAYVFILNTEGQWVQQQKLLPTDGMQQAGFGNSVAISSSGLLVAASTDNAAGENSGAVYVFQYDANASLWLQSQKLTAADTASEDNFGYSLSAFDSNIVIGALLSDAQGFESGAAYVFSANGLGVWSETQKLLPSDGGVNGLFGAGVALDSQLLAVGALGEGDGVTSGAVYLYEKNLQGTWQQVQKVSPSDGGSGDAFGLSIALRPPYMAVGAYQNNDPVSNTGAIYSFVQGEDQTWSQQVKLGITDPESDDWLGISVALHSDQLIAGALLDDVSGAESGAVYGYSFPLIVIATLNVPVMHWGGIILLWSILIYAVQSTLSRRRRGNNY